MGKPKAFIDAQAEEKKAKEREERARRLADPMPPTCGHAWWWMANRDENIPC